MKKAGHKIFLLIGIAGAIFAAAGNFMKKSGVSIGKPIQIFGLIAILIFWLYSVWDVLKSKFWTPETKIKYSLIVILLPIIGPFIFYYFKRDVVMFNDNNEHKQ